MPVIVEARGLWKVYETGSMEVQALRAVDIAVDTGEMVAVTGPSGSGKTTLLNCLSTLDEATAGSILVLGRPLDRMNDRERTALRGAKMGFIFQQYQLLPVLTAVENVELPLLLQGIGAVEARRRALKALEAVDLADRVAHRPAELSGGQQQRVAIARAFGHGPELLFADEPTGNLDTKTGDGIIELLVELNRERGLTVVLVTHDSSIAQVCTRQIEMVDGRIVSDTKQAVAFSEEE
jgi:putative ABC transport system ATP-binding protein